MDSRIILLEPASDIRGCYTYAGHNEFEPIGLEYIAAFLLEIGYEVNIIRQGSLSTDEIVKVIKEYNPQILGLSVMTHAANSALAIAKLAKSLIPGLYVIAGGYHPSGDPNYVLNPEIDFVVIGEGERVFTELISCLLAKNDYSKIKGISYAKAGKVIRTEPAPRIGDIDSLPFPIRSKEFLAPTKMHALMSPTPSKQHNVATLLSSRGCPNSCTFCCSGSVWGKKVVFRHPSNVRRELQGLIDNFETNAFFFSDLTFNGNRKHVLELCKELAKMKSIPSWYSMCTVTNLDEDVIEAMSKAGCRKIGFGVESLSANSLDRIGKKSITVHENTNRVLDACDRHGILTKAYLIIGYPWETHESLEEFKTTLHELCADEIRISYFTPFPGSMAYEEYRHQLVTQNWSKFNAIRDVILQNNNGVSPDELKETRISAFSQFYNSSQYCNRVERKIDRYPEFEESFAEFYSFLRAGNVLLTK